MIKLKFLLLFLLFFLASNVLHAQSNREEMIHQGNIAIEGKDFESAQFIYKQWMEIHPEDDEIKLKLALVYAWDKNFDQAKLLFEELIQNNPHNYDAKMGLARVYFWQGEHNQALELLNQMLISDPENQEIILLKNKIEVSEKNQKQWKASAGYQYEDISFFDEGGDLFSIALSYKYNQKWSFNGEYQYLDRFNLNSHQGKLGVSYKVSQKTSLIFESSYSPDQVLLPISSNSLEINYQLFKNFISLVKYRFAHYTNVDIHDFHVGFNWYILPKWMIEGRYIPSVSDFSMSHKFNHSGLGKINYYPSDKISLFSGFARTEESFESGNPINPVGSFSSQYVFGGIKWKFHENFGVDFLASQEKRSTDAKVITTNVALFYEW